MDRRKRRRAERLIKMLSGLLGLSLEVSSSERGRRLERYCARKCRSLGFHVADTTALGKPWDLIVNGYRVQCKSRRKHGKNLHGVNLFKNSRKRYSVGDVDFFVISFNRHCYVIPSSVISDEDGIVRGWVNLTNKRHFINAWDQFESGVVACDMQQLLFAGVETHGR